MFRSSTRCVLLRLKLSTRGVDSEFTLAPGSTNFGDIVTEGDEQALHGTPVDDVQEVDERLRALTIYVELAKSAFEQRGLAYPFEIDDSRQSLAVAVESKGFAIKVADLSRVHSGRRPCCQQFEKRAFRALQR